MNIGEQWVNMLESHGLSSRAMGYQEFDRSTMPHKHVGTTVKMEMIMHISLKIKAYLQLTAVSLLRRVLMMAVLFGNRLKHCLFMLLDFVK